MNSLYNHALKQTHALQRDLESKCRYFKNTVQPFVDTLFAFFLRVQVWRRYFNRTSRYLYTNRIKEAKQIVNMLGQISASFNTLQRSIDDYENLAKREMVPLKKETALT